MQKRKISHGFTLIEVLIALVILAIALAAAARAASIATVGAEESKLRTLATWVAQNRVALLTATRSFPASGTATGKSTLGGIEFEWQQTASDTPNALFRKIDVRVFRPNDPQTLTTLTAYLVQPAGDAR
jgi:general secretion pathway protein I